MVFDISQLPPSFKQFLSDNDIDPVIYTIDDLPRYIRINTHLDTSKQPTLQQLKDQLQTDEVEEVKDMPGFYSVQLTKTTQRISDMKAYKDHAIFGIDLSSALAVTALDINEDDQVLDLCCAPGAKLCMISNLLGKSGLGTVTGVDISSHRLATCRSLIKKYKVGEKVRLFEADGTQFCVPPPSRLGNRVILSTAEHKTKRQKSEYPVPFYASKLLRSDTQSSRGYYDKVLVDAECTHDGSIAHILKYEKWGWDTFEKKVMDSIRINSITQLQRDLMKQGWYMLKYDGVMIYSTCSLSIKQNEENIAWFLTHHKEALLEEIPTCHIQPAMIKKQDVNVDLQDEIEKYCMRFDPVVSHTSGFFVARIRKRKECK